MNNNDHPPPSAPTTNLLYGHTNIVETLNHELAQYEAMNLKNADVTMGTVPPFGSTAAVGGATGDVVGTGSTTTGTVTATTTTTATDTNFIVPNHLRTSGPVPYSPPPTPEGYTVAEHYL